MVFLNQLGHFPVSAFILIVTIGTSLLAWQREDVFRMFILHPWSLTRERRYYTAFTSGIIHNDFAHLAFNMLSFYFFAFELEDTIGPVRMAVLYLVSLGASDISTIIKHRNDPHYFCLGASGAVTAVIFSYIIFYPTARIGLLLIPIYIPAPLFGLLYVAYTYYSSKRPNTHINHSAHLWGAVSGLLLTLLLAPRAYVEFFDALKSLL
jgi:membrane associated rhomboid family serine protease